MSVIYYPKGSLLFRRDTLSASYEQVAINVVPNNVILYFDTSSNLNYISQSTIYFTASNALYAETSSNYKPITIKTGSYTIVDDDYTLLVSSSATSTIYLPSATTCTGRVYNVKNITPSLIYVSGSQNIDDATYKIVNQWSNITVQSNGTQWYII